MKKIFLFAIFAVAFSSVCSAYYDVYNVYIYSGGSSFNTNKEANQITFMGSLYVVQADCQVVGSGDAGVSATVTGSWNHLDYKKSGSESINQTSGNTEKKIEVPGNGGQYGQWTVNYEIHATNKSITSYATASIRIQAY